MADELPSSPPNFGSNLSDMELSDVLGEWQRGVFLALKCHHIGTIVSFNAILQTAKVNVNYPRTVIQTNEKTGGQDRISRAYPPLSDVPVVFLGGGNGSLTFPVTPGDECLILFNDRAIDTWLSGGGYASLPSNRLHSFSDAIALVGIRSYPNKLPSVDPLRVVLQKGATRVSVKGPAGADPGKVSIANSVQNLRDVLLDLVTTLQHFNAAVAAITVASIPIDNPAAFLDPLTGIIKQLTDNAAEIQGLLE